MQQVTLILLPLSPWLDKYYKQHLSKLEHRRIEYCYSFVFLEPRPDEQESSHSSNRKSNHFPEYQGSEIHMIPTTFSMNVIYEESP